MSLCWSVAKETLTPTEATRPQSELGSADFAVAARIRLANLYSCLKINYMPLTARVKWHLGACWPTRRRHCNSSCSCWPRRDISLSLKTMSIH